MFESLIPAFTSAMGGLGEMAGFAASEGPTTIAPTLGDIYGPQVTLGNNKANYTSWILIGAGVVVFALFLKRRR